MNYGAKVQIIMQTAKHFQYYEYFSENESLMNDNFAKKASLTHSTGQKGRYTECIKTLFVILTVLSYSCFGSF
jgi:hypothetical protein